MIIAVDGPTASGKGTLAKALAAHFGLPFLDTGLLYRAVGRHVQLHQGNPDDPADALAGCDFPDSILDDPVLRNEEIGGLASRVSIHPNVRAALNKRQVDFANQPGGALLDGRDIGTVVCPDDHAKLFITASAEVRARRRQAELGAEDYDAVLADIRARDERDSKRATAPLVAAKDAVTLDTSDMDIAAAVAAAIGAVEARRAP